MTNQEVLRKIKEITEQVKDGWTKMDYVSAMKDIKDLMDEVSFN